MAHFPRSGIVSLSLVALVACGGCAALAPGSAVPSMPKGKPAAGEAVPGRMLIWTADVTLEVDDVEQTAEQVAELAKKHGGRVASQRNRGEESARLKLRVPSAKLADVMAELETLGAVSDTSVSSRDVTEAYRDLDARLKNKLALRERLRALLTKAKDVKDVLAIEKEMVRLQEEIDVMQGRLKSLKDQVDMATLDVELRRRQILGPFGLALKGAFWVVRKLFVIQ